MGFILTQAYLALACAVAVTMAYPHGAPDEACATLNPTSHGNSTATGPNPYSLDISSDTYTTGQRITVVLSGALFKGFLVIAKKADNSSADPVGYFFATTDSKVACVNATAGNGITQTNNTVKTSASFQWKAPDTSVGDIVFHFTVVRGGAPDTKIKASDYYMDIISPPVKPAARDLPEKKISKALRFMSISEENNVMSPLSKLLRGLH